ncbi:MAG: thymidylate synthase [Methanobacteriota archaeon]|nr:MAG: thymidylate synthase [Euryarchaeota archaeon]
MQNYLDLLREIDANGIEKENRTGVKTKSVFGKSLEFDLAHGFPVVTTKKIHLKSVIHELLWFISGNTNIRYLQENGVRIWNEWADEEGNLGPIYGHMWRKWPCSDGTTIDQLGKAIETLKTDPDDRRIIVNAWNPEYLPIKGKSFSENVHLGKQALPPCHYSFQFVSYDNNGIRDLNLLWNQRSVDCFLGLPFNITSYALLLAMVAQVVKMRPRKLVFHGGDCHLYENHLEQVRKQIQRKPYPLPDLRLNPAIDNIDDFSYNDIEIVNYRHHSMLSGRVAV